MLRNAMIAPAAAALLSMVVPQATSAGGRYHRLDVVPWFLVDGATRLGVFPQWYVSEDYPYYVYGTVYACYAICGCYPIRRPGGYGWSTVQVCN
jgi:hypothetical protein